MTSYRDPRYWTGDCGNQSIRSTVCGILDIGTEHAGSTPPGWPPDFGWGGHKYKQKFGVMAPPVEYICVACGHEETML